jgi:hypothetical protein
MADDALARWLGERPLADVALVEMDEAQVPSFLARTKEIPTVISAIQQKTLIALFQEMMNRTMWVDLVFLGGFAGALAFSIVYNDARIALSERARARPSPVGGTPARLATNSSSFVLRPSSLVFFCRNWASRSAMFKPGGPRPHAVGL